MPPPRIARRRSPRRKRREILIAWDDCGGARRSVERANRRRPAEYRTTPARRPARPACPRVSGRPAHHARHGLHAIGHVISPARVAAFEALRSVAAGKSALPAALAVVRPTLADDRDRALVNDL